MKVPLPIFSSSSSPSRTQLFRIQTISGTAILSFICIFLIATRGGGGKTTQSLHHYPQQYQQQGALPLSESESTVSGSEATQIFQRVYTDQFWGPNGNGSGDGSTLSYTSRTRVIVELLITRYQIDTLCDAPCGAMAWMPATVERVRHFNPKFKYMGVDVVPTVIAANKERFKHVEYYDFEVIDMAEEPLPSGIDMIWCRDALQHLSYELIVPALENFAASDATYLAVGSYKYGKNMKIFIGGYFSIDLRQPPFSLVEVEDEMDEETPDGKVVYVYRTEYLKTVDFKEMRKRAGI